MFIFASSLHTYIDLVKDNFSKKNKRKLKNTCFSFIYVCIYFYFNFKDINQLYLDINLLENKKTKTVHSFTLNKKYQQQQNR